MNSASTEREQSLQEPLDLQSSIRLAGELALHTILDDYQEAIEAEAIVVAQRLAAEKRLLSLIESEVIFKLQSDMKFSARDFTVKVKEDRYSYLPPTIWIELTFSQAGFKRRKNDFEYQVKDYLLTVLRPFLASMLQTTEAPGSVHHNELFSFGIFSPRIKHSPQSL